MRSHIPIFLALLLGACSPQYFAARDAAIAAAAEANDRALGAAEFTICRAASIGSVLRRYASDPGRAGAWRTLCLDNGAAAQVLFEVEE